MTVAHPSVTDGLFCDTAPLSVSNGQVWAGLFCQPGQVVVPPVVGGGGSTSAPGTHFNQAPDTRKKSPLLLAQALREDEELIMILKEFIEVTQWH